GSEVEAAVVALQIPTSVPQLFVPGNHDSPAITAALDALPQVTVIDGRSVDVDGLRVFGVADPSSASSGLEPDSESLVADAKAAADSLAAGVASGEATPTIIAFHNPAMREPFLGLAELIVAGHTHTPVLEMRGGTWYLNSGTTGGIHFSKMRSDPHIPHSASILYYSAELPRRLIAIDQVEVYGLAGQSSVRRTVIEESLVP
ncbi:MAG: hypothetical protein Q8K89_08495, partial [Actinomycetota bacterium]|nr:hypothetical protein [Actinomycetota bacterium]